LPAKRKDNAQVLGVIIRKNVHGVIVDPILVNYKVAKNHGSVDTNPQQQIFIETEEAFTLQDLCLFTVQVVGNTVDGLLYAELVNVEPVEVHEVKSQEEFDRLMEDDDAPNRVE
jgi:hypothetical protein